MDFPISDADYEKLRQELKESFELLQQQLGIIERQLDGITVLATRGFTATLSPESRAAERRRGEELARKIAQEAEDKLNHEIEQRAAQGIPDGGNAVTDEDIKRWEQENLLT